jgi:hypothetical protein
MNNPLAIKKPIQSETIASKSDLMKKDTVSLIKDRLSDRKNSNESKKYYKLDGERAILMKEEATLN